MRAACFSFERTAVGKTSARPATRLITRSEAPMERVRCPLQMRCGMICTHGVTKRFGEVAAVHESDLCVERGEFVALLGPSGCGKTTLLRLIAGFERPDAGEIAIEERPVVGPGVWVAAHARGIGMVFQDYALFPHLTVAENIGFGLARRERKP